MNFRGNKFGPHADVFPPPSKNIRTDIMKFQWRHISTVSLWIFYLAMGFHFHLSAIYLVYPY